MRLSSGNVVAPPSAGAATKLSETCARVTYRVVPERALELSCTGLHLPWPGPRAGMIIVRSHAQRRAWPQPRSARAIRQATYCAVGARARARANPVAARLRSTSRDSSRATRLPALQRRQHPETTFKTPNPRASRSCCAF